MTSSAVGATKPDQWLIETPENNQYINWHDVGVASLALLGIVACIAVPVGS
jgi:hypothetical protein